jgi:hypothetical protein
MGPKAKVNLTAKWQLDASLLSRPVDLTSLVSMSKNTPEKFAEDNTCERLVSMLLNEKNNNKSDNDTKLDVLNIFANVAGTSPEANAVVLNALQQVSEWFDDYITQEEIDPSAEPELHKAMVLLLCRCWEYKLKTEDVLELTQGNRRVALCTVVGLLEDGETYSTELKQRQVPGQGKMGQWEHELVCQRYERPLLLQICRLLRGFTHPGTYFEAKEGGEVELLSVERFADEMDILLDITLKSRLVEKLSVALYDCLFEQEDRLLENDLDNDNCDGNGNGMVGVDVLEESDHLAVASVHAFLQNLYFYASENNDEFRHHMLVETLLIPRLILPYLDRCVLHAKILNSRAEAYADMLEGDQVAEMALHNPQLVKGIAGSLRTLILASFRAPATQFVMALLRKLNPTSQILKARTFCRYHEYIFALLCLLNVNMGALDLSKVSYNSDDNGETEEDAYDAHALLHELSQVYNDMSTDVQQSVYKRVMSSGALPIARDTPSYVAIMSVLNGGEAGQLEYILNGKGSGQDDDDGDDFGNTMLRSEAKQAHAERMANIPTIQNDSDNDDESNQPQPKGEAKGGSIEETDSKGNPITAASSSSSIVTDNYEAKGDGAGTGADSKTTNGGSSGSRFGGGAVGSDSRDSKSLLGNLPSLGKGANHAANVKVALSLQIPSDEQYKNKGKGGKLDIDSVTQNNKGGPKKSLDPEVPQEFVCAINGHVMKEPVQSTTGYHFERATIELWIQTRGNICPITHTPLTLDDLKPAKDLKNEIKRYHIQKTSLRITSNQEDDLYDF